MTAAIECIIVLLTMITCAAAARNEIHENHHHTLLNGRRIGSGEYVHVVYACDQEMLAFAVISIASVVRSSLDASRLYFHIALVDLKWTADVLQDLKDVLHRSNDSAASSYEVVSWLQLPDVLRTMKLRGSRDDLHSPANYVRFYVDQIFTESIPR